MLKSLSGDAECRRSTRLTIVLATVLSLAVTIAIAHAQRAPDTSASPTPSSVSSPAGPARFNPAQLTAKPPQWDYEQSWVCGNPSETEQEFRDRLRSSLNAEGRQGWELVAFTPIPAVAPKRDCFIATFKRPRPIGARDWPTP